MSSLSINTSLNALSAKRREKVSSSSRDERLESLASELTIDRGTEDASELAISRELSSRIKGDTQTLQTLQDGISRLQTADGGTEEIQENLRSLRELSVEAANGESLSESDREALQDRVEELTDEINRISDETEFNGQKLLNGDISDGTQVQTGSEEDPTVSLSLGDLSAESLGLSDVRLTSSDGANAAVDSVTGAINQVATERADVDAAIDQLESTVDSSLIQRENEQAANSEIRDANLARQATEQAQDTLRTDAGTSTFAQANGLEGSSALNLLQ